MRGLRLVAVGVLAAMLGACASNYPTRTVSYKETAIDRPATPPSETELLAVRIEAFKPGALPENKDVAKGLSPEIRNAEGYYIPVQLKTTMQKSGHWGAVRVVPRGSRGGEVVVSGTIQESDGEILKLAITVADATGATWFTKEYESVIDTNAYRKAEQGNVDPFQHLYNQIANDIAAHKKTLQRTELASIRQVAELRFGAEFAPQAYEGYLKKPDGRPEPGDMQRLLAFITSGPNSARQTTYAVQRLPAEDDPIVQRVNRIRAREEFLVDTLDQQYDGLARGVGDTYTNWRSSRLKEINAIRQADQANNEGKAKGVGVGILGLLAGAAIASQDRKDRRCYGCTTAGVVVAGAGVAIGAQMAIRASEQASAETKLRQAALEELGQSLAADVKPTVIEVEGKTVELKGTIEEKFQSWRRALKELYDSENAPLPTIPAATPAPSDPPPAPTS